VSRWGAIIIIIYCVFRFTPFANPPQSSEESSTWSGSKTLEPKNRRVPGHSRVAFRRRAVACAALVWLCSSSKMCRREWRTGSVKRPAGFPERNRNFSFSAEGKGGGVAGPASWTGASLLAWVHFISFDRLLSRARYADTSSWAPHPELQNTSEPQYFEMAFIRFVFKRQLYSFFLKKKSQLYARKFPRTAHN
jgi:hypothetical protein